MPKRFFVVVWLDHASDPRITEDVHGDPAFYPTLEDASREASVSADGGDRPFIVCELKPVRAFSVRHEVVSEETETF
jgi:hypothetical protein